MGDLCDAGIWRTRVYEYRTERHTMAMITVNGKGHPIFSRMHKPEDEKRAVVILHPDDWEEWLTTSNIEAARAMLQLYPADEMYAKAK
ncbi:hypothetical protein WL68_19460 [Burkholderia cepacia]|nr:hypothetical protein WL68_19460 [Burkholderia cepacia]KWD74708.1 hypothetical protein WL69_29065 [Burkholderia cepacia]